MVGLSKGQMHSIEEEVTPNLAASKIGSGALDVYSTPSMIALMERASMLCVSKCLLETQTTVGGSVNIRHRKASAIGSKIKCIAKLIGIDGKKIEFEVSASENGVLIGDGLHTRFIVDKEKFMSSV